MNADTLLLFPVQKTLEQKNHSVVIISIQNKSLEIIYRFTIKKFTRRQKSVQLSSSSSSSAGRGLDLKQTRSTLKQTLKGFISRAEVSNIKSLVSTFENLMR